MSKIYSEYLCSKYILEQGEVKSLSKINDSAKKAATQKAEKGINFF